MSSFVRLQQNWREYLAVMINGAKSEIFISSPYVTAEGTNFIASNLSSEIQANGTISILTNLTPQNIAHGATDPKAIQTLQKIAPNFNLWHLPSLHAKVYIADRDNAIITSGNLTSGGLIRNFEYGVGIGDKVFVQEILKDVVRLI
jgi:phosphatidylserine/phosphatidylglycerophosphate/cardiolipin synthase-like enzyme